jgi:hypothetical protein
VALAAPEGSGADPETDVEPTHYFRAVELPLRPIDLEALLDPDKKQEVADNEDEEGDGMTIADCIDVSKLSLAGTGLSQSDLATIQAAVANTPAAAFSAYAGVLAGNPAVNPDCL